MKRSLSALMFIIAALAFVGCKESTGGGADPKPVGNDKLKPLPAPGSPADAPVIGKKGAKTATPGAGPGAE